LLEASTGGNIIRASGAVMVPNTGKASVVALTRTSRGVQGIRASGAAMVLATGPGAPTRVGVGVAVMADAGGAVVQAIEASVDLDSNFFSSLRNGSDGRKK
jgi:hypothetical protein